MRDAYDNLFKHIDKNNFFKTSLEDIIYIEPKKVQVQWNELQKDIFENRIIHIRGYGRDAKKTQYFITLYKHLFGNENVVKDSTNNAQPTKLIKCNTAFCKITEDGKNGKERIRNYQVSHLFGRTKNPLLFNCAWNIAYIPKYLDPFTGHETQGDYSFEFKNLILPHLKNEFGEYIAEYNEIVQSKILGRLDAAIAEARKELKINIKDFVRFEQDAKNELNII